ncbi:PH domain-containing protein [Candidatus Daviesbacteria bacterium]|nr:PH domain-containing protein [Candidatus Daviesbacteria bacterium]
MGKSKYSEGASAKDKKSFAPFLAEDEELILATGYGKNYLRHRFAFYLMIPGAIFILGGLAFAYFTKGDLGYGLLIGLAVAIIFALLKTFWTYHAHRYLLTTRRVIIKEGFFAVKLTSALYDKITHIEVDQGIIDRLIMRHGNVVVNTAGMNKGEIKLEFVDSPIEFKNLLERLINREREHYGRPTGTVVAVEGEVID